MIEPFSSIKLPIIFLPTVPGTAQAEFELVFAYGAYRNVSRVIKSSSLVAYLAHHVSESKGSAFNFHNGQTYFLGSHWNVAFRLCSNILEACINLVPWIFHKYSALNVMNISQRILKNTLNSLNQGTVD